MFIVWFNCLKDFMALSLEYIGLNKLYADDFDYTEWRNRWRIKSNDYMCGVSWKLINKEASFGEFHDAISSHPIPLISALANRMGEICVRTTFVVITLIASLLLAELDEQIENFDENSLENDINTNNMPKYLEKWKSDYDLVNEFIEQLNKCFGLAILLTTGFDYFVAIIEFHNILNDFFSPRYYLHFIHIVLRFLLILWVSQQIESKVFKHCNSLNS